MQKRVLIVSADAELRRELGGEEGRKAVGLDFEFADTAVEALTRLGRQNYTAVLAEWHLDGATRGNLLLDEVMRRQPSALRFIRATLDDQVAAMRCIGTAHRFLIEPTDVQTLRYAIEQALWMETWLPFERVRSLLTRLRNIPSPPQIYFEVVSQLQSPEVSLDDIGETIARDPAITAKLLQLVNSAVFGLQLQVGHPAEAIGYLGLEATKSLVILAHTFSHFADLVTPGFSIEGLWNHSHSTARCARWIAEFESRDSGLAAHTFTAGLLHDFGKIVLAANHSKEFQRALQRATDEQIETWQAELDQFGTHHGEVGACLLAIWGLPMPIIQAVGLHHRPVRFSEAEFTPLAAVHVANVFAQTVELHRPQPALPQLDMAYLQEFVSGDRIADWTRIISEMANTTPAAV